MPILYGSINDFKFARLLLARSIDRSIDHYKMFNIDTMNQYFYVREGENRPLADSYPPALRNTDSFCQKFTFCNDRKIDRSIKQVADEQT